MLVADEPSGGSIVYSSMSLYIGSVPGFGEGFYGKIDDVRIYNRALSSNEVQQLYVTEGLNAGLVAYYPFNGNANDESGNGNNGTTNGVTLTTDRFGNSGKAYSFDGGTAYISVSDSIPLRLANTDFTLSAWVYETARNSSFCDAILTKRGSGSGDGWLWSVRGELGAIESERLPGRLWYQVCGGGEPRAVSASVLPLNGWHHLVATYTKADGTIRIYEDGVLDNTTTGIPSPNAATSAALHIGDDSDGSPYNFHGKIDDVRIYNRALSSSEVMQLYAVDWRPTLGAMHQGVNLVFSWPTNVSTFTLESATNLGPSAVWTPVSPAPVVVNGQFFITNSLSEPAMFYRLKK